MIISIIGFNEVDALKKCIPNLLKFGAKQIRFYDGPFTEYQSEYDYSTDGTLEYLTSIPEVKIIKCGRMRHIEKQNKRFEDSKDEDYILIVDCDEMVHGNYESFEYCLKKISDKYIFPCFNIPFSDLDMHYSGRYSIPRIFKNPANWKVKDKHWFFYYDNTRIDVQQCPIIGGMMILHDSSVRPTYREDKMKDFQKVYTPKEDKDWLVKNDLYIPKNGITCYPCGCTIGYAYYHTDEQPPKRMARDINIRCANHGIHK